ncbi:MAG: ABC transporter ATP-binding protein [Salinigranum sp.]
MATGTSHARDVEATSDGTKNEVVFQAFDVKQYYPVTAGPLQRKVGDVKAVDGVDLTIRRGRTRGLVGESGCGKSTLARVLARLDEPTAGHVYFDVPTDAAEEIADLERTDDRTPDQRRRLESLRAEHELGSMSGERATRFRRNVQFVFQNPTSSLNPKKLIRHIVGQPLRVHTDLSGADVEERSIELLEEVGLGEEIMYRYPHTLSGGQKQRVAIARAIALNPECVILDEPTSALDVSVQARILNLLEELQTRLDLTYLFISHDLGVIRHVADDISVMYLGHVVEEASRDDLFRERKHPYTEALISSSPAIDVDERVRLEGDVPDPENPPTGCPFHGRCHEAESFCGWSGRDLEALLRRRAETDPEVRTLFEALGDATYDGYRAEYTFDRSLDEERLSRLFDGEIGGLRESTPALFEAIDDVSVRDNSAVVRFREVDVPELTVEGSGHRVACFLYDEAVD